MLENFLVKVVSWFHDRSERRDMLIEFNDAAKKSFISGEVPTLLKAELPSGYEPYRHSFSNRWKSGFRIKIFSGRQMSKEEIIAVGNFILANDPLIRKLVVLGFDTLEIHCDEGNYGCRWQLKEFLQLSNSNI